MNTLAHRTTRSHPKRSFSLFSWLFAADNVWRQRQRLAQLDPHLRRDIGVTEDDIRLENKRPVWDAPEFWRR